MNTIMENQKTMKWYIVRAQANRERSVSEKLTKESLKGTLTGKIGQVIVPMEKTVSVKSGKKVIREKIMYPGYIFVETSSVGELTHFVKACDGAIGLLSSKSGQVQQVSDLEVQRMIGVSKDTIEIAETNFVAGQEIKIIDGPFTNFNGTIESVNEQRVKVGVMIFGRKTIVDLELNQIDKIV
jgi:transcriptional antiterminator NusG